MSSQVEDTDLTTSFVLDWVFSRLQLKGVNNISQLPSDAGAILMRWLTDWSKRFLVAYLNDGCVEFETIALSGKLKDGSIKKYSYFFKPPNTGAILKTNIHELVTFGVSEGRPIDHLLHLMNTVYIPLSLADSEWPHNVKKDLSSGVVRFMAAITEVAWQQKGQTVLYLPAEDLSNPKDVAQETDIVRRMDTLLTHWTRQIKDITAVSQATDGVSSGVIDADQAGPLDELKFWEERLEDSRRLVEQLESPRVEKVLAVLSEGKGANPANVRAFCELKRDIEANRLEAENNVKFLSILKQPCEQLSKASPSDIPGLLPDILARVRFISMYSEKYTSADRITSLLRKVANELIRRCTAYIDLEKIWKGDVSEPQQRLKESILVGKAWRETFRATVNLIAKHSSHRWECSEASIFAQVDAFAQRCADLLTVCSAQDHFGSFSTKRREPATLPKFGGTRAQDILKSLSDIETAFLAAVDKLRRASNEVQSHALDVKAPGWHEEFAQFRTNVRDLERMYRSVIDTAFDTVPNVHAGAEVLDAFYSVCRRAKVRAHLDLKALALRDMLLQSIAAAKHEHETASSSSPSISVALQLPTLAGSALWAKGILAKLKRELAAVETLWYLPVNRQRQAAIEAYQAAIHAGNSHVEPPTFPENVAIQSFEASVRGFFEKWLQQLQGMQLETLHQKLSTVILTRVSAGGKARQAIPGALENNFDHSLLAVLNETYYWEKVQGQGITVPFAASQVAVRGEELRQAREHVMRVVRDYNRIRAALSREEWNLFHRQVTNLHDKLALGQQKERGGITWDRAGTGIKIFVTNVCAECAAFYHILTSHHKWSRTINNICDDIVKEQLILLDHRSAMDLDVFVEKQKRCREEVLQRLKAKHEEAVETIIMSLGLLRDCIISDTRKIQPQWFAYVKSKDERLEAAFRKVVKQSIAALHRALTPSGAGESKSRSDGEFVPLFRATAVLSGIRPTFKPDSDEVLKIIQETLHKITSSLSYLQRLGLRMIQIVKERDNVQMETLQADPDVSESALSQMRNLVSTVNMLSPELNGVENYAPTNSRGSSSDADDLGELVQKVLEAHKACASSMTNALDQYKDSTPHDSGDSSFKLVVYHPPLCLDKETQIKKYSRNSTSERTVEDIAADVEAYNILRQDCLSTKETRQILGYVDANFTPLRDEYLRHCQEWIDLFLKLLRSGAARLMHQLVEYVEDKSKQLQTVARTPEQLRDLLNVFTSARHELATQEGRVGPIQARFAALEEHHIQKQLSNVCISDDDQKLLNKLPSLVDNYKQNLDAADESLKAQKKIFRTKLENDLNELQRSSDDFYIKVRKTAPTDPNVQSMEQVKQWFSQQRAELEKFNEKEASFASQIEMFNLEPRDRDSLEKANKFVDDLEGTWELLEVWTDFWASQKVKEFSGINVEVLEDETGGFLRRVMQRKSIADSLPVWQVTKKMVESAKGSIPLMHNLRTPALRDRHWAEMKMKVGKPFDQTADDFTLNTIFNVGLVEKSDLVENLAVRAKKESRVEESLRAIEAKWTSWTLKIDRHGDFYVMNFKGVDIFEELDKDTQEISNHKATPFHIPFTSELDQWESALGRTSDACEKIRDVQRGWLYLENIFKSPDIREELVTESQLFEEVSFRLCSVLERMSKNPIAIHACADAKIVPEMTELTVMLEKIQKAMQEYMQTKRDIFPRFYFISDEDLLEILGRSRDSECLQTHLKKVFEGIDRLEVTEIPAKKLANGKVEPNSFIANVMIADDGERIPLHRPIQLSDAVEEWFNGLEASMRETICREMIIAHQGLNKANTKTKGQSTSAMKEEWITRTPGQLIIAASQIRWSKEVSSVLLEMQDGHIGKKKMESLKKDLKKNTGSLAKLVRRVDGITRSKLCALITIEVHNRDVVDQLYKERVDAVNHFSWTSQLRFGWDGPMGDNRADFAKHNGSYDDLPRVRAFQTETVTNYEYEYQGNNGRLVITPLTDKCYMTLTLALHLNLGGSPQGPAGTGKTETVKDLGKGLGKFVLVTNCSDKHNFKDMERLFSGLSQSGSWGCFDEFNRIKIDVLSVVATQARAIEEALARFDRIPPGGYITPSDRDRTGQTTQTHLFFTLGGRRMKMKPSCGIFITMNPTYAGRTELPDNLKSLFRPVAMMAPDFNMICEIMLMSEGFKEAKELARRTATLFHLMVQQLSKRDHYDFTLRSIKSVLNRAGNLIRDASKNGNEVSKEDEFYLVMRAICDMNMPKFVGDDIDLFNALVSDLFPRMEVKVEPREQLETAIREVLDKHTLEQHPQILRKCIELYETKLTRHGYMLVGNTMSGKSTVWKVLTQAITLCKEKNLPGWELVKTQVINPKSISIEELYGWMDMKMGEWHKGILSDVMKTFCEDTKSDEKIIVLDGPVDTLWIESMNTVLDDNKLLTLTNGDRISLPRQVSLLFEVENLAVASPATVSRAGMVYMDVDLLGWKPYSSSWCRKFAKNSSLPDAASLLSNLFDRYVPPLFDVRRQCKELVSTSETAAVVSLTRLFDAQMADLEKLVKTLDNESLVILVEKVFVFSLIWSVGATINGEFRPRFDHALRDIENHFPPTSLCFDCALVPDKLDWELWDDRIPHPFVPAAHLPFHKMIVPTVDTARHAYLLKLLVSQKRNVMCLGETGTGKTCCISENIILSANNQTTTTLTINFSAQTSSLKTQQIIETKAVHSHKNIRKPENNKDLIVFCDDFNMPRKDEFGSQPPLELLRQFMDYGSWYARADKHSGLMMIERTQLLAAMGPPGGGRSQISHRLLSKFHVLNFVIPNEEQTFRIFNSLAAHKLSMANFGDDVAEIQEALVRATLNVYADVSKSFTYAPDKPHYLFNLRDVSKVWQGIFQAEPHSMKKEQVLKLWYHEVCRVFRDRLSNHKDQLDFRVLCAAKVEEQGDFACQLKDICKDESDLIFMALTLGAPNDEDPKYQHMVNRVELKKYFESRLEDYNTNTKKGRMNLVLFTDAVEHICRIHRIIRLPLGHAMLIGVGGSGRHSLTRLASFLASVPPLKEVRTFQIEITKAYDHSSFREDLKQLSQQAGVRAQDVVFLFGDRDAITPSFWEDVGSLLSSGEVPNLFQGDDLQNVLNDLRPAAKNAEPPVPFLQDQMYDFFLGRVKDHLHIAVCLSPIGKTFRDICKLYPAFVNNVTMDWFHPWPNQALREVAYKLLASSTVPSNQIEDVSKFLGGAHLLVSEVSEKMHSEVRRHNYVTPTNYLELVYGYISLLESKQSSFESLASTLENGGQILAEARVRIQELEEEIKIKQAKAQEAAAKSKIIKEEAAKSQAEAMMSQERVEADRIRINGERDAVIEIQESARRDLEAALPSLEAAKQAVYSLEPKHLSEVKTYRSVSREVTLTLIAVIDIIEPMRKNNWERVKERIAKPDVMPKLRALIDEGEMIPTQAINKISLYCKDDTLKPEKIFDKSFAAGHLSKFVNAMKEYADKLSEIEPKKKRLALEEEKLRRSEEALATAEEDLRQLKLKLAESEAALKAATETERTALAEAERASQKRERARQLLEGLAGEGERWEKEAKEYRFQMDFLVGDCIVSAAILAYCGPFAANYRTLMLNKWRQDCKHCNIQLSKNYNFVQFLVDNLTVNQWIALTLPPDDFSLENGVLVTNTKRWPLLIDPQDQGNKWIREMFNPNNYLNGDTKRAVLQIFDPKSFNMTKIERAIESGRPVLLEKVLEELDPALEPLLAKDIRTEGGQKIMVLGDTKRDLHPDFDFFITTKLGNPHYTPEVSTKVTVVNFTVSEMGLTEQLLQRIIKEESPEDASQKRELQKSIADSQREVKELQDDILRRLGEYKIVEGQETKDITDDQMLIDTLHRSKARFTEIEANVKIVTEKMQLLDIQREHFRSAGRCASVLYFVLADLAGIEPMYQYSLEAYVALFVKSIIECRTRFPLDDVHRKVENLNKLHTLEVYRYACNGLFERHKPLLALHLTAKIKISENIADKTVLDETGWRFFLRGSQTIGSVNDSSNPGKDWISKNMWDDMKAMESLSITKGFATNFENQLPAWRKWIMSAEPEIGSLNPMPGDYEKSSPLVKLIIAKSLRPDRTMFAATLFVERMMGKSFAESPRLDYEDFYTQTSNKIPALFILSPGFDPTPRLNDLRKALKIEDELLQVSLGEGQDIFATNALQVGAQEGRWVFLANCHLCASWLPTLEKLIEQVAKTAHENFRLWLSSDPTDKFPIALLQKCVKATTEAPRGIRPNLSRLLALQKDDSFNAANSEYRRLYFAVCWFHTILLERRQFKTLGWNVPYDFNDSDFNTSMDVLSMYLDQFGTEAQSRIAAETGRAPQIFPWEAIRYLVARAIYGGRVTEDRDMQVVSVYCAQYLNPLVSAANTEFRLVAQQPSYIIPADPYLARLRRLVSSEFSDRDMPEAFGQHVNAAISSQIQDGHALLKSLSSISGAETNTSSSGKDKPGSSSKPTRGAAANNDSEEDKNANDYPTLRTVNDIEALLPEGVDLEEVLSRRDKSPLHIVLIQEVQRYNELIFSILRSLKEMRDGLLGHVVMTDEVERNVSALESNAVPSSWKKAYPSLKPLGSWMRDLNARIAQLQNWTTNGPPLIFWLGGLTYPNGYLTALLQRASRHDGDSIDKYAFDFEPCKSMDESEILRHAQALQIGPPGVRNHQELSSFVSGLYLEGAKWDLANACLSEPTPMELVVRMPIVRFIPINTVTNTARTSKPRAVVEEDGSKKKKLKDQDTGAAEVTSYKDGVQYFGCPLFMYPVRTGSRERPSFMISVDLVSGAVDSSHWVKRGTALLLATAD